MGTVTENRFKDDLEPLLQSGNFSDVTISLGGARFRLHKLVLATRVPALADVIGQQHLGAGSIDMELNINVPVVTMEQFFKYIYSGKMPDADQLTLQLLEVAVKFKDVPLQTACVAHQANTLSADSLPDCLKMATDLNLPSLKEICFNYLAKMSNEVIYLPSWQLLTLDRPQLSSEAIFYLDEQIQSLKRQLEETKKKLPVVAKPCTTRCRCKKSSKSCHN